MSFTSSCPPPPDASASVLERKVEELSGQLVSLAQRARQQQELLDKIWEKVNALPLPPTATPRPPTPAVSKEFTMPDVPAQAPHSPRPPPPSPQAWRCQPSRMLRVLVQSPPPLVP